jgi:hypothetical protein
VAGDADEADDAFVPRLDRRLQRPAFAQSDLPFDHVDEVVQLDQVDPVQAEPLEGTADLLLGPLVVTLVGLRGDEEPVRVALQPRGDP